MSTAYIMAALEHGRPTHPCACEDCVCQLHTWSEGSVCVWCAHGKHGGDLRCPRCKAQLLGSEEDGGPWCTCGFDAEDSFGEFSREIGTRVINAAEPACDEFAGRVHGDDIEAEFCRCDGSCPNESGPHTCRFCGAIWVVRDPYTSRARAEYVEVPS